MEEKNEKKSIISFEEKIEICQNNKIKDENIISMNNINIEKNEKENINLETKKVKIITKEYNEEDEKIDINIKYKKDGISLFAISLDLLLKKIVTENFLKKNPIKIYSFCQQCFSFIDKEILFNKIFNCYDFYKKKKTNTINIFNLIKFLNILVIEMYEYYYPNIKLDSPIIRSLNDFYQILMLEIFDFINKKEREKGENQNSNIEINKEEFQNKIEDKKEIKDKNTEIIKAQYSPNKEKNIIKDNSQNKALNTKKLKLNNTKKNEPKFYTTNDNQINNKNPSGKRGSIFSKSIFMNFKNEFEIKLKNKINKNDNKEKIDKNDNKERNDNKKEKNDNKDKKGKNESNIEEPKPKEDNSRIKRINTMKKREPISPEEEIVTEITNIKILFSLETKRRELEQTKSKITFYKNIKNLLAESIGKPIKNSEINKIKSRHVILKSVTLSTLNNNKLNLPNNEGYFNILDWDSDLIGEKLISVSKNNINKIQRHELYGAIFLKKDKMVTCPILMDSIEKFNQLTFFIIQDILSYDFSKDRAKIIEKWVTIAQYCKERKDYNDCVAINSALNNYIITGLDRSLKNMSKEKKELMKNISKFCRYQGNFKILREEIAKLDYSDYYIPYLGMLLKDLSFFEENSKYIINDTLINFEKLENVQLSMEKFFNFKNAKDKIYPILPEELSFFDNLENLNETELENLANKLEPEFKLYSKQKKVKRKTNIDLKYFSKMNSENYSIND